MLRGRARSYSTQAAAAVFRVPPATAQPNAPHIVASAKAAQGVQVAVSAPQIRQKGTGNEGAMSVSM